MRNVADTGGAFKIDALPAGEHFGAAAALAKARIRRLRGGEAPACGRTDLARRRLWDGVGVPAQARRSQEDGHGAVAKRWAKTLFAAGGLLNRAGGAAEEQ